MKILRWKVSRNKYSMNHNVCSTTSKCVFFFHFDQCKINAKHRTDQQSFLGSARIYYTCSISQNAPGKRQNQPNKQKSTSSGKTPTFKNTYNLTWKYYQFYILHWAILIFYISCVKTCCLKTPLFAYMNYLLRFSRSFITLISLFFFFQITFQLKPSNFIFEMTKSQFSSHDLLFYLFIFNFFTLAGKREEKELKYHFSYHDYCHWLLAN